MIDDDNPEDQYENQSEEEEIKDEVKEEDNEENKNEELICRFCQCEGTDDNKLVHPCKCKGSVKWVHEECLRTWLRQSHKVQCELCGYKYVFKRGYGDEFDEKPPKLSITDFLLDLSNRAWTGFLKYSKMALIGFSFIFRLYFSIWVNHLFLDGSFSMYLPENVTSIDMHILDPFNPFITEEEELAAIANNNDDQQIIDVEDVFYAFIAYIFVGLLLNIPYSLFSAIFPQEYKVHIPLLNELEVLRRDLEQEITVKKTIQFTIYSVLFKGLTSGILICFPYMFGSTLLNFLNFASFGTIPSKQDVLTDPDIGGGIFARLLIMFIGYLLFFALFMTSHTLNKNSNSHSNNSDAAVNIIDNTNEQVNNNELNNVNANINVNEQRQRQNAERAILKNLSTVFRYVFIFSMLAIVIPLIGGLTEKALNPLYCDPFGNIPHPSGFKYIVVELVSLHSSGESYFIGTLVYLAACTQNAGARLLDLFARALSNWSFAILSSVVLALFNIFFALSSAVSCTLTFNLWNPDFLPLRGGAIVDANIKFDADTTFLPYYTSISQALYYVPLCTFFSITFWPLTKLLFRNQGNRRVSLVLRGMLLSVLHFVFLVSITGPFTYVLATLYRDYVPEDEDELLGIKRFIFILGIVAFGLVSLCKKLISLLAGIHNLIELLKTIFRGVFGTCYHILVNIVLTIVLMITSGISIYMIVSTIYKPSKQQNIILNDNAISIGLSYLFLVLNVNRFIYTFRGGDETGIFHNVGKILRRHCSFWVRVFLSSVAIRNILGSLPFRNDALKYIVEKRYILSAAVVLLGTGIEKVVTWVKSKYTLARDRRYARVAIRNYEE